MCNSLATGTLVVLHDRKLGRTVPARGAVRKWNLDELRAMDAGRWFSDTYGGAHVLSLREVLDLTKDRVALNVEIKSPLADWAATAGVLTDQLRQHDRLESTIISSFRICALCAVRHAAPAARLGVLWRRRNIGSAWPHAAALGATSVHVAQHLVQASVVAAAHERGLKLMVWTVNDADSVAYLNRLGVDGIISDYPELFAENQGGQDLGAGV